MAKTRSKTAPATAGDPVAIDADVDYEITLRRPVRFGLTVLRPDQSHRLRGAALSELLEANGTGVLAAAPVAAG